MCIKRGVCWSSEEEREKEGERRTIYENKIRDLCRGDEKIN